MDKFSKENEKVYLLVNDEGRTENVFATLGMALHAMAYRKTRICPEFITHDSLTRTEWTGRDGKARSLQVQEVWVCKDVTTDYMCEPRDVTLTKE